VRPEQGLFTAIVAGFIISALGGSRVQIGGPTGAFVVIVAGIVAKFGYPGLAIATIMAGALLVAMSFARLGNVIKFIPYPVIIGFTSGIAIIIAMGQIGDGLGLPAGEAPSHFWPRCLYYIRSLPQTNITAAAICLGSVLITQQWSRISRRLPGPLIALLLTTIVVQVFNLQVDTIGSRFGDVPTGLPRPSLPRFDFSQIGALFSPALSIALLGAIESLLSAMVADGMIGGRHRANAELMGQGIANLVVPFFGGIPATGAIARTATNVKNGGRSPVAGIVHSLTLLLILMAAGKWAAYIPLATLAGILLVVAYNMSEWRVFRQLLRSPRGDVLVLLSTFVLTVVVDLNVAIQVGMVLSSVLLMLRMAEVTQVRAVRDALEYESAPGDPVGPVEPAGRSGRLRDQRHLLLRRRPFLHRDAAVGPPAPPRGHPAHAPCDGHRRHGPARAGRREEPAAPAGHHAAAGRRPRPAAGGHDPRRGRPAHRPGQHVLHVQRCGGAREGTPGKAGLGPPARPPLAAPARHR
jgi:SulP family sulfate permease